MKPSNSHAWKLQPSVIASRAYIDTCIATYLKLYTYVSNRIFIICKSLTSNYLMNMLLQENLSGICKK